MKIRAMMPAFTGVENWLNSEPVKRETLQGKWTLIYVWSMSCTDCERQFGQLKQLVARYEELQWLSIHMPRVAADNDVKKVKRYAKKLGHEEPVAIDEQLLLTARFNTQFVPSYYVFDEASLLRYYQSGDRSLKLLEQRLVRFLV